MEYQKIFEILKTGGAVITFIGYAVKAAKFICEKFFEKMRKELRIIEIIQSLQEIKELLEAHTQSKQVEPPKSKRRGQAPPRYKDL